MEIAGDRISVRFAPPFGPIAPPRAAGDDQHPEATPEPEAAPEPNPLDDPATFGGDDVPGYELDDEE